jgi:hypothetical protein
MITLKGDNIYIRALEPNDLEFIYAIENEQTIWEVSNTQTLTVGFSETIFRECTSGYL